MHNTFILHSMLTTDAGKKLSSCDNEHQGVRTATSNESQTQVSHINVTQLHYMFASCDNCTNMTMHHVCHTYTHTVHACLVLQMTFPSGMFLSLCCNHGADTFVSHVVFHHRKYECAHGWRNIDFEKNDQIACSRDKSKASTRKRRVQRVMTSSTAEYSTANDKTCSAMQQ
jgi:hypothetical protein